ncbi:MAG: hypothetical protein AAGF07_02500 [Patescibacteria group bacterium]
MQKLIVVIGAGGHGWESLRSFFDYRPESHYFKLYTQTTDWGGFTGLLGRLMEYNDGELNYLLHGNKIQVLPWGDTNKRVGFYLARQYGVQVAQTMDLRSYHIWDLKQEFLILSDFLALEQTTINQFNVYLETFYKYFNQSAETLPYITPPCLGSLWNQYLYWQTGSLQSWNEFYNSKHSSPENLEFLFTSEVREELIVESSDSYLSLVGEDVIDKHPSPIDPASLVIKNVKHSQFQVNSDFLENLQKADLIIIPNGSLANWIPLVNISEVQSCLKQKASENKLIWLLNLFHTSNEHKIHKYISYLDSLGVNPIIIGPKNPEKQPSAEILNNYHNEQKFLNLKTAQDIEKIANFGNNIVLDLDFNLDYTYKYTPESVRDSILKIFHDW